MKYFSRLLIALLGAVAAVLLLATPALAFCGFYVAKADASLYNQASQVVIARDGDRTVLTMANDYQGAVQDFALVVPVPGVLKQEQVRVGEAKIIERLDGFSAPRLVEYFDANPCEVYFPTRGAGDGVFQSAPEAESRGRDRSLGVTVESQFTVGEYDIVILSALESDGLETWLRQNGYQIPQGAAQLLQPYIRQGLKFFVAKVNLAEFDKGGFRSLRPLMMAYESPRFMLPIRLGMINAQGEQDLIIYLLSPKGQAELVNYRLVKIPSDANIPEFVQQKFPEFYRALFNTAHQREQKKVAFLEYAWDMGSCDPCSADPLTPEELKQAGVFWLTPEQLGNGSANVFITRMHVRYSRDRFPEDLRFQETGNREQFQGRYVIQHPYKGEIACGAAQPYQASVRERQEQEIQILARLTGWPTQEIRQQVKLINLEPQPWWRQLFN
ncbi:MAG: DUF2330 domain-containing protein [Oscillatoriales cyanobacterium RM2_1_1]|nr:DUF2330 domain-containing protein [Oscillatoriales cyanobacterium SM2_3_0]NJO45360.1 DUF2330 domain-containing protein [Oscillatoriales cyanobacterium RM2_1_1]